MKKNKVLLLLLFVVSFLGILTGVLVAIKSGLQISTLGDYNLSICDCSGALKFAGLWERFSSCLLVSGIIFVASLCVYTLPIGFFVIGYRAYLVGFNCALMFCLFGVSGALTSVLIVFPCQVLLLLVFIELFVLLVNFQDEKRKFCKKHGRISIILFCLLFIFLICLIESVLLGVFSAKTLLVI